MTCGSDRAFTIKFRSLHSNFRIADKNEAAGAADAAVVAGEWF